MIGAFLVLAAIGGVGLLLVLAGRSNTVCRRGRDRKDFRCTYNLSQLAGLWLEQHGDDPDGCMTSGPALVLGWRRDGTIRAGEEEVLLCPGDNGAFVPDTPAARRRYDVVDLAAPPDDLASYAVRDFARFPVDPSRAADEPILACVGNFRDGTWCAHHRDVFIVAYADGRCRMLRCEELGLSRGEAPVVGPDSPSPVLRVLTFGPAAR